MQEFFMTKRNNSSNDKKWRLSDDLTDLTVMKHLQIITDASERSIERVVTDYSRDVAKLPTSNQDKAAVEYINSIVEDVAVVLMSIKTTLNNSKATNADEAEAISHFKSSAILLDIMFNNDKIEKETIWQNLNGIGLDSIQKSLGAIKEIDNRTLKAMACKINRRHKTVSSLYEKYFDNLAPKEAARNATEQQPAKNEFK